MGAATVSSLASAAANRPCHRSSTVSMVSCIHWKAWLAGLVRSWASSVPWAAVTWPRRSWSMARVISAWLWKYGERASRLARSSRSDSLTVSAGGS